MSSPPAPMSVFRPVPPPSVSAPPLPRIESLPAPVAMTFAAPCVPSMMSAVAPCPPSATELKPKPSLSASMFSRLSTSLPRATVPSHAVSLVRDRVKVAFGAVR